MEIIHLRKKFPMDIHSCSSKLMSPWLCRDEAYFLMPFVTLRVFKTDVHMLWHEPCWKSNQRWTKLTDVSIIECRAYWCQQNYNPCKYMCIYCMYTHTYTYVYTYIHVCIHIHTRIDTVFNVHIYMFGYKYVYIPYILHVYLHCYTVDYMNLCKIDPRWPHTKWFG